MPYDTFFNLPDDKRERVIEASLEEFALYDYKTASLSRIVEKVGIAKGSMYQYFENKKDLYLYLIDYAAKVKLDYLSQNAPAASGRDFFEVYKDISYESTKFNLSNPKYSRILYHAARETFNEELGDVAVQLRTVSKNYMKERLAKAQEEGQVRKDVDLDLMAFCVSQLSIDLEDYLSNKFNFSYGDMLKNGREEFPVSHDKVEEILEELITFFKRGLKA